MLNNFGSCLNYQVVEELETELAYAILERGLTCPDGATSGILCGLAYDNYDEQTHTLSGADNGIFIRLVRLRHSLHQEQRLMNAFLKNHRCFVQDLKRGGHWKFCAQRLLHTGKNLVWTGFPTKT